MGVEVVGLGGLKSAAVHHLLPLPVYVLKLSRLVPGLEGVLAGSVVEAGQSQVLEDGMGRAGKGVKEGVELLLSATVEDVELFLALGLLDHIKEWGCKFIQMSRGSDKYASTFYGDARKKMAKTPNAT